MGNISAAATSHLIQMLKSNTGVDARASEIALEEGIEHIAAVHTILLQNAAADLTERTLQGKYPAVLVYCDKLSNTLKEKFRLFSGTARLCVEIRCTRDRLEGLDERLQLYSAAVCRVLEHGRGQWTSTLYYAGQYEVAFGAVRTGGNYFLQSAKVVVEIEVSR